MKRTEFTKAEIEDDDIEIDRLWLWVGGAVALAVIVGCIAATVCFFKLMGSV